MHLIHVIHCCGIVIGIVTGTGSSLRHVRQ
jgi:hypothetical protein